MRESAIVAPTRLMTLSRNSPSLQLQKLFGNCECPQWLESGHANKRPECRYLGTGIQPEPPTSLSSVKTAMAILPLGL